MVSHSISYLFYSFLVLKCLNDNVKQILNATNGFWSIFKGIDRKDVRIVCHFNIPKSMEAFYQESGRAGRDQLLSRSLLYYGIDDRKRMVCYVTLMLLFMSFQFACFSLGFLFSLFICCRNLF